MNPIRNATDSLAAFRERRTVFEASCRDRIAQVQKEYGGVPSTANSEDSLLEAHVRTYLVDWLLVALGWHIDGTPGMGEGNLMPEVSVASLDRQTRRYLDYLGLERDTDQPLLVVETKHPNSQLPINETRSATVTTTVRSELPSDSGLAVAQHIANVLSNEDLNGVDMSREWRDWLRTLRDYVRSVKAIVGIAPRRVVMTNGNWLVLFVVPEATFCDANQCDPGEILVFVNRDEIEDRYHRVFEYLEHRNVLGASTSVSLGQLPFCLSPDYVSRVMHGVRLIYAEEPGFYESRPLIKVTPVLFVGSKSGAWLRVESGWEDRMPMHSDGLRQHLAMVQNQGFDLLTQVNRALRLDLVASSVEEHYADESSFGVLHGVTEIGSGSGKYRDFLIVTGRWTHFLRQDRTVRHCPYHRWEHSKAQRREASPEPIIVPTIAPRSFFTSGEQHHCAHKVVLEAKNSQVTPTNRLRCGTRSGKDGDAFCEIWGFEEFQCCRTCVFEGVCTKAGAFVLPCSRGRRSTRAP